MTGPRVVRHVLVTVQIATEGRHCRDWTHPGGGEACAFLSSDYETCRLFHFELKRVEDADGAWRFERAPACLALDEESK